LATFYDKLPEHLKQFVDPSLPREKRLMSARGVIPLPPKDIALLLFCLVLDDDKEISGEAEQTIAQIPQKVMEMILPDQNTPPELLHYVAMTSKEQSLLQAVILNPSTSDITIANLARSLDNPMLLDLIANNQQRLLRSQEIFEAISVNPALSRSSLERIISFLSLHLSAGGLGGAYEENVYVIEDECADAHVPQLNSLEGVHPSLERSFVDDFQLSQETVEESAEPSREKEENIAAKIKKMSVGEKVKLALLGNKEARTILARETVRIVHAALLKNPRITEQEIVSLAQSTAVDQDILRQISLDRKWIKQYPVKQALVYNPKTPTHISMPLVKHMLEKDLRSLAQSKDVPGIIATTARRLLAEKRR
jgi:hypothetical protein